MQLLIPGDKISDEQLNMPGTIVHDYATFAAVVGTFDSEKKIFMPLEDLWYPRTDDSVVGTVEGKHSSTYTINLGSPYKGAIMTKYERTRLSTGDVIEAAVREFKQFDDAMIVMLTRPRKLYGGVLLNIKPSKIPRVIGHGNTMLKQITDMTGSSITVGGNGIIWLKGGEVNLAAEAIRAIEAEAHIPGLTERIKKMLEDAKSKK